MLEGLDRIDWASLHHAYGAATDLPQLIRDLASDDKRTRSHAMSNLYTNIWHQCTVYEASIYAVPFLIELVQDTHVHDRGEILGLLEDLARGSSFLDVHAPLIPKADLGSPETQAQLQRELGWVRATHDAVGRGIPVFLEALHDPDPRIGASSAYTLACFPERAGELISALRPELDDDLSGLVKNSIILCIGLLGAKDVETIRMLEACVEQHSRPTRRLAAALALARVWRDAAPDKAAHILDQAAEDPGWEEPGFIPWDQIMPCQKRGPDSPFAELYPTLSRMSDITDQWNRDEFVYVYVCAP